MSTHTQLADQVQSLFWDYAYLRVYKPQFKTVPKETLLELIRLHRTFTSGSLPERPPTPLTRLLRHGAYDAYKQRMQRYFDRGGTDLSVACLSVPQLEAVTNYLAGVRHPDEDFYRWEAERKRRSVSPDSGDALDARVDAILGAYACEFYFPVRSAGLHANHKRAILAFVEQYHCRHSIRPPLPNHCKIFMEAYYQYRRRAQEFFDKVGFPVKAEHLTLPVIEALLNFMVDDKAPDWKRYRKVFAAGRMRPVDFFVKMYKPCESPRYPISPGQYQGRKEEITPLLYFKPVDAVRRWFDPPASTKIKKGRRRLFLNYRVIFEQYGLEVAPTILPIAYIEAVINYAETRTAQRPATAEVLRAS